MRNILIGVAEQAIPVVITYYSSSLPNNTYFIFLHSQLTGPHPQTNVQIYLTFFILKAPNHLFHHVENFIDLHYVHSAVLLTINSSPLISSNNPYLIDKTTDWVKFNELKTTKLDIKLKSSDDIKDAITNLITSI
jgi:hypothetical protein